MDQWLPPYNFHEFQKIFPYNNGDLQDIIVPPYIAMLTDGGSVGGRA